jgi:hypothetical protein
MATEKQAASPYTRGALKVDSGGTEREKHHARHHTRKDRPAPPSRTLDVEMWHMPRARSRGTQHTPTGGTGSGNAHDAPQLVPPSGPTSWLCGATWGGLARVIIEVDRT